MTIYAYKREGLEKLGDKKAKEIEDITDFYITHVSSEDIWEYKEMEE